MSSVADSAVDISILIVNWNVRDLLDRCLASIAQFTKSVSFEVIVVDSGSTDESVALVKQKFPWVKLIDAQENVGFTKGNNLALHLATGRYIGYLNPDTELVEDIFGPLISHLEKSPKIGVVGPKLLNTDRSLQNSIGHFTRLTSLLKEYFLRTKAERQQLRYPVTPTVVDYVMGACMVVPTDLCRAIGGLDERFFMNHEETDFCLQLKRRGYATVYDPTVSLIHHGGQSSKVSVESRQRFQHENRKSQYLYFQKNSSWLTAQTAKLIIGLAMISRIIALKIIGLFKKNATSQVKVEYFAKTVAWLATH